MSSWPVRAASWSKLMSLLSISQGCPNRRRAWSTDRRFNPPQSTSKVDQTYPKTGTGPSDDNSTMEAVGFGHNHELFNPRW